MAVTKKTAFARLIAIKLLYFPQQKIALKISKILCGDERE
jgi:hypothetical protein